MPLTGSSQRWVVAGITAKTARALHGVLAVVQREGPRGRCCRLGRSAAALPPAVTPSVSSSSRSWTILVTQQTQMIVVLQVAVAAGVGMMVEAQGPSSWCLHITGGPALQPVLV
jgi:hypothetical protein